MYRFLIILLLILSSSSAKSLGVLTHEAIVDAAWDKSILPLLKSRYPAATAEDLKTAHAYAYGGAVTPDMGYYPFSSPLFTNLVHYVRSGDMVIALLKDAENLNQLAFALGFLSHYNADNYGHPMATNKSVALVYPKLKKKYGSYITYADNRISHMRMEFGFDVLQTAKGNYASPAYHSFIGFKVDTAVLAKAFFETYGLDINKVFGNHLSMSVEIFRYTAANIFPVITRAGWKIKKAEIVKKGQTATSAKFKYKMHRREYNKEFGTGYKHPGFFPGLLSFFIRVLPKVGPTRALKFKTPNAEAEKYFDNSFDTIMKHYTAGIQQLMHPATSLKDIDFDTGNPTASCEYSLADKTYSQWLIKLSADSNKTLTPAIRQNLLGFYKPVIGAFQGSRSKSCRAVVKAYAEMKKDHRP